MEWEKGSESPREAREMAGDRFAARKASAAAGELKGTPGGKAEELKMERMSREEAESSGSEEEERAARPRRRELWRRPGWRGRGRGTGGHTGWVWEEVGGLEGGRWGWSWTH